MNAEERREDVLASLGLAPDEVPGLAARVRSALVAYLIRWEQYDAARRCLQQLLVTHSHLVSVYDELATVYLGLGRPEQALEIMNRRQALKVSTLSQDREAQVHLAAGNVAKARAISDELIAQSPSMLRTWRLQAEVCLAAGTLDDAEAALKQLDTLQPEAADTAQRLARLWQARGDDEKALLWARTALSRTERDEHRPAPALLRLLESLYRATNRPAQAEATAARLREQQEQELEALRPLLGLTLPQAAPAPARPVPAPIHPPAAPLPAPPTLTAEEHARLFEALRRYFPHDDFRPGQAEVIGAVLRGESVLAVMPTGAGKSLCYQLAALLLPGTTLVISPLIALMKDQIDGLPAGVAARATTLNSSLDGSELEARLARAAAGEYRLLYAAPERLRQRPFLHALKRAGVSLLVVDEAHCVSLWGHDFRPDYRFIVKAWEELGRPPILAMTATATPRVRDDIQAALGRMTLVAADVHRPNLHLEARSFANDGQKQEALVALCREIKGSGIVYANSRKKCEELAALLRRRGVQAIHYHAGVDDRAAAQDRFMSGQARVVVATVAFGMGVDKADVRFIIHYHPPRALENYYQEAGRAGRDGLPARCILFHAASDKANLTRWTHQDALQLEFLRQAYAAVQRRLRGQTVGLITVADLERDLKADETRVRVAIHFLETAGLVWRGFDLPRTATLALVGSGAAYLTSSGTYRNSSGTAYQNSGGGSHAAVLPGMGAQPSAEQDEFARFVQTARLMPGQTVSRDLLGVSREAGLDPRTIEAHLLAWEDAGWLSYRGIGRDMLLALPQPPADSRERVAALLADYLAGQDGRIAEMMAYATTRLCRHGYISAYFGGQPIEQCPSCDNCRVLRAGPARAGKRSPQPVTHPSLQPTPPARTAAGAVIPVTTRPTAPQPSASRPVTGRDVTTTILEGVAQLPFALGRTGLSRALKGLGSSPVEADRFPLFGALAGQTRKHIGEMAAELVEQGLLAYVEKGPYRLLQLTEAGKAWLAAPRPEPAPQPAQTEARKDAETPIFTAEAAATPQDEPRKDYDEALFEALRIWQQKVAKEIGKPPFMVLPLTTLKLIAATRPATLEELAAIKGVGPVKLEQYGQAVLAVVARQGEGPAEGV